MGIRLLSSTWAKNFFKRRPVKIIGKINITLYAVLESLLWVSYSVLLPPIIGLVWSAFGMIILGLVMHALFYAHEAVSMLNKHSVYETGKKVSFGRSVKELCLAVFHLPTIPDTSWPPHVDVRIWYPAVYRFIWFSLSVLYSLYHFLDINS